MALWSSSQNMGASRTFPWWFGLGLLTECSAWRWLTGGSSQDSEKNISLVQGSGVREQGKAKVKGRRLRVRANFFTIGGEKFLLVRQFAAQVFSLAVAAFGRHAHGHHVSMERSSKFPGGTGMHTQWAMTAKLESTPQTIYPDGFFPGVEGDKNVPFRTPHQGGGNKNRESWGPPRFGRHTKLMCLCTYIRKHVALESTR